MVKTGPQSIPKRVRTCSSMKPEWVVFQQAVLPFIEFPIPFAYVFRKILTVSGKDLLSGALGVNSGQKFTTQKCSLTQ
jgi:hypothetical protein